MRGRVLATTLAAWAVLVVAIGYWRIFYAWRVGSTFRFVLHDMPILFAVLVVVLSTVGLLLRRSR